MLSSLVSPITIEVIETVKTSGDMLPIWISAIASFVLAFVAFIGLVSTWVMHRTTLLEHERLFGSDINKRRLNEVTSWALAIIDTTPSWAKEYILAPESEDKATTVSLFSESISDQNVNWAILIDKYTRLIAHSSYIMKYAKDSEKKWLKSWMPIGQESEMALTKLVIECNSRLIDLVGTLNVFLDGEFRHGVIIDKETGEITSEITTKAEYVSVLIDELRDIHFKANDIIRSASYHTTSKYKYMDTNIMFHKRW